MVFRSRDVISSGSFMSAQFMLLSAMRVITDPPGIGRISGESAGGLGVLESCLDVRESTAGARVRAVRQGAEVDLVLGEFLPALSLYVVEVAVAHVELELHQGRTRALSPVEIERHLGRRQVVGELEVGVGDDDKLAGDGDVSGEHLIGGLRAVGGVDGATGTLDGNVPTDESRASNAVDSEQAEPSGQGSDTGEGGGGLALRRGLETLGGSRPVQKLLTVPLKVHAVPLRARVAPSVYGVKVRQ